MKCSSLVPINHQSPPSVYWVKGFREKTSSLWLSCHGSFYALLQYSMYSSLWQWHFLYYLATVRAFLPIFFVKLQRVEQKMVRNCHSSCVLTLPHWIYMRLCHQQKIALVSPLMANPPLCAKTIGCNFSDYKTKPLVSKLGLIAFN